MSRVSRKTTILGGLPVMATVWFDRDDFSGEYLAEVEEICWVKRNGKPGKEIPQKVRDRAAVYDPCFCCLVEDVSEQLAWERENERV